MVIVEIARSDAGNSALSPGVAYATMARSGCPLWTTQTTRVCLVTTSGRSAGWKRCSSLIVNRYAGRPSIEVIAPG